MSSDTVQVSTPPERDVPFSFDGYTIANWLITKRTPVPGNKRIPICLYCGTRHGLQKISRHKAVLYNGIKVEYEEDWYYCEHTKGYFMTRQMDKRNDQRRQEAYEHSPLRNAEAQQDDRIKKE